MFSAARAPAARVRAELDDRNWLGALRSVAPIARKGSLTLFAPNLVDELIRIEFAGLGIFRLTGDPDPQAFLGRPLRDYAPVAFIRCKMDAHVKPEGWHNWGKESNEQTARYAEYGSTGPGANPQQRVPWSRQLTKEEADRITPSAVLGGPDGWDPSSTK